MRVTASMISYEWRLGNHDSLTNSDETSIDSICLLKSCNRGAVVSRDTV